MAAQEGMTRARGAGTKPPDVAPEVKPKGRRINMIDLFDIVDDIWGFLERNESRTRYFGRLHDIHKEEFESIRTRLASARELLHPRDIAEDDPDGKPTDDRTDQ